MQDESSDLASLEDSLLTSRKEPRSAWRSSIKEENEFLQLQALQNQSEMETLRRRLKTCFEEKERLESRVEGLVAELEEEKRSAKNIKEAMQKLQADIPRISSINDHSRDVTSNGCELETMVDAIAAVSQREAEAHETVITVGKENDDLREKLKASIEDNKKLIELYEVAAAEVSKAREYQSNNGLAEQLQDMHDENDKLMGLYEKAMEERDEYKKRILSYGQKTGEVQEEFNCPEKLVEVDGGEVCRFDNLPSKLSEEMRFPSLVVESGIHSEDPFIDAHCQTGTQADTIDIGESSNKKTTCNFLSPEVSEELVIARNKLDNVPDKLANVGEALKLFGSLEKVLIKEGKLATDIEIAEEGILAKKQEIAGISQFSSQIQNRKCVVENKLSALKFSTSKISSSIFYWEQREARAKARVDSSHIYVDKKTEALVQLRTKMEENDIAIRKGEASELELRDHLVSLNSKVEKESLRKESEKVLFAIENFDITNILAERPWQEVKATDLLKVQEERTKLKSEIKQYKEKLSSVLKEIESCRRRSKELDSETKTTEGDIVTGMQSAQEMELAYQNVVQEKVTLQEMSESGINDIQTMTVEYHECVFECDLKENEMKILEHELQTELQNLEALRASMTTGTQIKGRLLDEARRSLMITGEQHNQSWFASEKVEQVLQEVWMSVVEAKSLLDGGQ